ncbi:hypothetical protein Tco_0549414 [Tanacetum coccineum]
MDREVNSLKRSRILLVKVHWNSERSPEFTLEREDHMKSKYPQLFVDRAVESARSGYHRKDRKPSQNDKLSMNGKDCAKIQGQSPKIPKSESITKISSQTEPERRILWMQS